MQRRAMRLKKIPVTCAAIELSPGTATWITFGRDIAQPEPATIATVGFRTEMIGGVDVPAAASCRSNRRGWRRRWLQPGSLDRLLTSSARGFTGETQKGLGLFGALALAHQRLGWHWASCSRLRWPQPIEYQEQRHQGDQPELVENEMGYHGTAPSHRWKKGHCTGFLDGWNYPQATGTRPDVRSGCVSTRSHGRYYRACRPPTARDRPIQSQ